MILYNVRRNVFYVVLSMISNFFVKMIDLRLYLSVFLGARTCPVEPPLILFQSTFQSHE